MRWICALVLLLVPLSMAASPIGSPPGSGATGDLLKSGDFAAGELLCAVGTGDTVQSCLAGATLDAAGLNLPAHATDGSSFALSEGEDDGTASWGFKVPDSGLDGNTAYRIEPRADGLLPGSVLFDATNLLSTSWNWATGAAGDLFAALLGSRMDACATDIVKGGGYNATTGEYDWLCANNSAALSGDYGGTVAAGSGRVADWATAATSGGNAYRITCTGAGVGTTQDGNTVDVRTDLAFTGGTASSGSTSTVVDSGADYATNALRGYYVFIDSGTGSGQSRQIVANTSDTITIGGDSLFSPAPDNTSVYSVHNLYPSNCYAAGETVILNAMADVMIAQDLVREGGTVYWPAIGGNPTIYVHTGCGRKSMGTRTTAYSGNNCPVLQRQNSGHYQRDMHLGFRNAMHDLGPRDNDLFNLKDGAGREGVYLVMDTGGVTSQADYHDPSATNQGSAAEHYLNTRPIGLGGETTNTANCVPISTTDPRCDVTRTFGTASQGQGYTWVRDPLSLASNAHLNLKNNADVTSAVAVCVNDEVNTSTDKGFCEDDPRILCTVAGNGARTSTTAGGCQFSGAPPPTDDLGPCVSMADGLDAWTDTRSDRAPQLAMVAQNAWIFPGTTYAGSRDNHWGRIHTAPGTACGSPTTEGATVSLSPTSSAGSWPLVVSTIDVANGAGGTGQPTFLWLHSDWYSPDGGVRGGTITPNSFFGRDVDANGSSDPKHGDCLSGGAASSTDDESGCDGKAVFNFLNIHGAGLYDSLVALGGRDDISQGAGSWFDSADYGGMRVAKRLVVSHGRRSRVADWVCVDTDDVRFENNNSDSSAVFTPWFNSRCANMAEMTFAFNNGIATIGTPTEARHGALRNVTMIGNIGQKAQVMFSAGGDFLFENFHISGGSFPGIMITPYYGAISNVTLRHGRMYGMNASSPIASDSAKAFVDFSVLGSAVADDAFDIPNNAARSFRIDDLWIEAGTSNTALVAFDDANQTTAPDERDYAINTLRKSTVITNSGIDCVEGATGCEPIIVVVHSGAGELASADTGILNEQYVPTWEQVYEDGAPLADQPWPQGVAAGCGDCNTAGLAGRVCHISDDTTANACADAGVDGTLDGGGAARSVCVCGADTNWSSF